MRPTLEECKALPPVRQAVGAPRAPDNAARGGRRGPPAANPALPVARFWSTLRACASPILRPGQGCFRHPCRRPQRTDPPRLDLPRTARGGQDHRRAWPWPASCNAPRRATEPPARMPFLSEVAALQSSDILLSPPTPTTPETTGRRHAENRVHLRRAGGLPAGPRSPPRRNPGRPRAPDPTMRWLRQRPAGAAVDGPWKIFILKCAGLFETWIGPNAHLCQAICGGRPTRGTMLHSSAWTHHRPCRPRFAAV